MQTNKRQRPVSPAADVTRIVKDLNHAVTTAQRLRALDQLFSLMQYSFETRECSADPRILETLIESGLIHALCLQLGYMLHKRTKTVADNEIEQLCRAIEVAHRCSSKARDLSMKDILYDLVNLLLQTMAYVEESSSKKNTIHREIMATMNSSSGNTLGAEILVRCNGLFSTIVEVLLDKMTANEIIAETLGLLKNLTYHAEGHRITMLEHPGLLMSLTRLPLVTSLDKCSERLSGIFRNFSVTPDARLIMAQHTDLLNALIRMSSDSSSNQRVTRNILNTIVGMAMEPDSCIALSLHGEGIILNVLSRFVAKDPDPVARRRAARALRCLARENTTNLLLSNENTIRILSNSALHDEVREVRNEAAEAFATCAVGVDSEMPYYNAVLTALVDLTRNGTLNCTLLASVIRQQSARSQNRIHMVEHPGLVSLIAKIATCDSSTAIARQDAIRSLHHLSEEEANRKKMATTDVLQALVKNSTQLDEEYRIIRSSATCAIVNLASLPSNRKCMVPRVLKALLKYAATVSADNPMKSDVKKTILTLVPEL